MDFRKANGSTPLIVHSLAGNKEVVQALIEEKANVDVQDNDGWSALLIASRVGHIEVVRSLIYAGAIPDLKNKEVGYFLLMVDTTVRDHLVSIYFAGFNSADVCYTGRSYKCDKGTTSS